MIALIDYDAGNIKSVEKAFQSLGKEVVLTRDPALYLFYYQDFPSAHLQE